MFILDAGEIMTQQRSEETRGRLLDAAVRKFAEAGYDGSSVDDICMEAGVSKGAFYHHFPSKQALFLALMNGWLGLIDIGLEAVQKDTVPETLIHMTNLLPAVFAAAEDRLPMFLEFWLQASRDETIWNAIIAPYHHYQDHFARLIEKGVAEGSLKPVDARVAAQVIVSMAVGLVLQGILDPHSADWAKVTQQSLQLLLNGLEIKKETK
jgi:AcrR family transcriptional regulator